MLLLMIHKNKDKFKQILEQTASRTNFSMHLLEKDYYLTLILSRINELSKSLVFKGGTCLNKIYYSYFRLSEDLDFSMLLPEYEVSRNKRRQLMQPIKENIENFASRFGMKLLNAKNAGRNESKQYIYNFNYSSVLRPGEFNIKFEVSLRYGILQENQIHPIRHKFVHPFSGEPLFNAGNVRCLSLEEIVAEKMRAAATRKTIAPRDFYDIDFIIRNGFDITAPVVIELFKQKLKEEGANSDMKKYGHNLGRTEKEIQDMSSRIEKELLDVLVLKERENFNVNDALTRINKALAKFIT